MLPGSISSTVTGTSNRSSPGPVPDPAAATTAVAASCRPPSSITTSSICVCSSKTSRRGAGPANPPAACSSSPTHPPPPLFSPPALPRLAEPLPRALPPAVDRDLMAAVARLDDDFARTAIIVLRATGMRIGELLDLELDCLVTFGTHGTWLKVPVGKLGTERMVPLDPEPLDALDTWIR